MLLKWQFVDVKYNNTIDYYTDCSHDHRTTCATFIQWAVKNLSNTTVSVC